MQRSTFNYDLPAELIAQQPPAERGSSRLLVLEGDTGALADRAFSDLESLLRPGDLLVFNDTRVLPARLHGTKASGGRVEVFLERIVSPTTALVQIKASHSPKIGGALSLPGGAEAHVIGRQGALFELDFGADAQACFERHGSIPLPPYIDRTPSSDDVARYQTVFARHPGAVAAPTAGLHFDQPLLERLAVNGIELGYLTLHVGLGTFAPVRVDSIEAHEIHAERLCVPDALCAQIASARARGGRIVAVGTTVVRALETAAAGGSLRPFEGESRLFIYPGFAFHVVDAMVTNFHLPESSLLMLVAAFAGIDATMCAYRHAVAERSRFFSYGDAMFVTPTVPVRA
jgi:S-adenosylmethionine:tRNA ribosyltransferase-isomerase